MTGVRFDPRRALDPWQYVLDRLAMTSFHGFPPDRRLAYRAAASRKRADWHVPGDARLELSEPQFLALTYAAEGKDPDFIASRAEVSQRRVARWLKTPAFVRAVRAERLQPTTESFRGAALRHGLTEENETRREQALGEEAPNG